MMLRALNALKCLSHSAGDAGITRTRFATPDNSGNDVHAHSTTEKDRIHQVMHDQKPRSSETIVVQRKITELENSLALDLQRGVKYTVFKKKFTLLLFAITKSDVDRFQ